MIVLFRQRDALAIPGSTQIPWRDTRRLPATTAAIDSALKTFVQAATQMQTDSTNQFKLKRAMLDLLELLCVRSYTAGADVRLKDFKALVVDKTQPTSEHQLNKAVYRVMQFTSLYRPSLSPATAKQYIEDVLKAAVPLAWCYGNTDVTPADLYELSIPVWENHGNYYTFSCVIYQ